MFKQRVSEGRGLNIDFVDSVGQGRIWSGSRATSIGLVDRIGGIEDAIASAAKMAKLDDYGLREYPEPQNIFSYFMGSREETMKREAIENELGKDGIKTYKALRSLKDMIGITQARIPFTYQLQQ